MLNHITIMGRLTRDPELRYTQTQTPVANFAIACDRDYTKGDEKKADFVEVVCWRKTAEFAQKYFFKGDAVIVSGRLQMRDWTDKEGHKRVQAEVVADNLYFGQSKQKGDRRTTVPPVDIDAGGFEDLEDAGDIPF